MLHNTRLQAKIAFLLFVCFELIFKVRILLDKKNDPVAFHTIPIECPTGFFLLVETAIIF